MAKPRRAKRPAAAATDAASDDKKQKRRGFVITFTAVAPADVSPVPLVFDAAVESRRASQKAKAAATRVERYGYHDFAKFATSFAAAIASASAKKGRPVTLTEAITEMREMTKCEPKFKAGDKTKLNWCWGGFARGQWQISRNVRIHRGGSVFEEVLVPFPKGSSRNSKPSKWKFSPSPAAHDPMVELSC